MKKKRWINFLLLAVSLGAVCFVSELFLRSITFSHPVFGDSTEAYRLNWLIKHRLNDKEITNDVIDDFHPVYGWILKKNLNGFPAFNYRVSSDKNRTRVAYLPEVSRNGTRVIGLGDSFVFGECVSDSATFLAQMMQMDSTTETINLAVHGWGNDQMLLRLIAEGASYKPDVVLLGCLNDDLSRNHLQFRDFAKPYFDIVSDSLSLSGVPVSAPENILKKHSFMLWNYCAAAWSYLFGTTGRKEADMLSGKIIQKIVSETESMHAQALLVYLPGQQECIDGKSKPDKVFEQIRENKRVLWVDPTNAIHQFLTTQTKPQQHFDCHYSPAIHTIIASEILKQLNKVE